MDTTGTLLLPPSGSSFAPEVDALFAFLFYVSLFFLIVIFTAVIFFLVKYRRRNGETTTSTVTAHNTFLEISWTVIPLIIVLILFFWGFRVYMKMSIVPKDALEIKVTGQKWFWSFVYPNGATAVNELVVPMGKPIKLLMSSQDVIHSFYVPAFRIKRDVLPNRYTIIWFEATNPGVFDLMCAEYCGSGHSKMLGRVRVVNDREYAQWMETAGAPEEGLPPQEMGEKLYKSKGCISCHSTDGTPGNGPSFRGVFGHKVSFIDGTSTTVDENYLRQSILEPQAKVVAGYQPIMPTYQTILKEDQIDALIAFIKSLSNEGLTP